MELLTIKTTPKSAFVTIPKGDTLFGQILSYLFLKNDKTFFQNLNGYEEVTSQIEEIAKLLTKKTLFLWGLGITEHLDGTEAVNAISNLAMITGNIGKMVQELCL